MKKLLILCTILLAVLLSGCVADTSQRQSATNTPKASTPQEETSASFEPVSTESSAPTKAPAEAADPTDCIPNEDKHESDAAISSEPVSAPTESNAPVSEETEQPPVLPKKPEKTENPAEEPSAPAITEPEPAFDIDYWISYAKSTAASLGLTLDSSATECWDNPITAKPTCIYLERDINSRLNRYAKDEEITAVWIWYECVGTSSYLIYIGYA